MLAKVLQVVLLFRNKEQLSIVDRVVYRISPQAVECYLRHQEWYLVFSMCLSLHIVILKLIWVILTVMLFQRLLRDPCKLLHPRRRQTNCKMS